MAGIRGRLTGVVVGAEWRESLDEARSLHHKGWKGEFGGWHSWHQRHRSSLRTGYCIRLEFSLRCGASIVVYIYETMYFEFQTEADGSSFCEAI